MKLFLLRHATAAQRNLRTYPNDDARPLISAGKREALRAARMLRAKKVTFDHIISSPLTRARQTAEIVAKVHKSEVKFTAHFAPEGNMRDLIKHLRHTCAREATVLLVGHEPYMTQLISLLISGKEGVNIRLKKGGLCKLTADSLRFGRCGRLDWLLTPRFTVKS